MNRKSLPFLLLAALLTVAYISCRKPDDVKTDLGPTNEYFPLEIGKYVVYDVDSTIWDDTLCVKRFYRYQIKYTVADTFTDVQNRLSYRIVTSIRQKPEDLWENQEVMYATNTGAVLEQVYNELRFIKLTFPIVEGYTWKGNTHINNGDTAKGYFFDWNYVYRNVGDPYNTGDVIYDNTITVDERDEQINDPEVLPDEFASRTFSKEVYASGVGMVYREYIRWTYDPATTKCRKGTGVIMNAVDHN